MAHLWQETSAAGEKSDCPGHQQVLLLHTQVQRFCVAQPDQQTWQAAPVVLMLISDQKIDFSDPRSLAPFVSNICHQHKCSLEMISVAWNLIFEN